MARVNTLVQGTILDTFRAKNLRIGVLHAGGPAPGGNRVVYAAALRARDHSIPVVAFRNGYKHLQTGNVPDEGFIEIGREQIRYLREQNALLIGTSRANPGKPIAALEDLSDPQKTAALDKVLNVFEALRIGALISVGGDDTMRTANLVQTRFQTLVAAGQTFASFMGAVHVPKTIDKDYRGIDFTFGFLSAADTIGSKIEGLRSDAKAAGESSQPVYHVVEVMGRAAGWLAAASGIIGQATLTFVPEDYPKKVQLSELAKICVDMIMKRRKVDRKHFGVFVVSEGIGELIAAEDAAKDEHGHIKLDALDLGAQLKDAIAAEFQARCPNKKIKLHSHKEGYAARQVRPISFDALLCQRLGVSAVDAILSGQFGNLISIEGVFNPKLVPFKDLIDPVTLRPRQWPMDLDGGLYQLLRAMEQPF